MAQEGKVEVVTPSKYGEGIFRVKIGETWYSSKGQREGLTAGNTVKFNTVVEGRDTFINQFKVTAVGAPPAKRGGGGGGFKSNPAAEKRYAEQGEREAQKWAHQLGVVEPRITWSDSRSKAIEYAGLCIANGAIALGAENPAKRKAVLDAFIAAETRRFFDESMALGQVAKTQPAVVTQGGTMDDLESDDLDDVGGDDLDADDLA